MRRDVLTSPTTSVVTVLLLAVMVADVNPAMAEQPDVKLEPNQATNKSVYFPPPESQGGWRAVENDDEIETVGGMDKAKIAELREWLLKSDVRPFAAVVIRHGTIVLQVERRNSAATDSRRVASVSKAICATVLAIVPSLDLVIARQTGSSGQWDYEEYLRRACEAVLHDR